MVKQLKIRKKELSSLLGTVGFIKKDSRINDEIMQRIYMSASNVSSYHVTAHITWKINNRLEAMGIEEPLFRADEHMKQVHHPFENNDDINKKKIQYLPDALKMV